LLFPAKLRGNRERTECPRPRRLSRSLRGFERQSKGIAEASRGLRRQQNHRLEDHSALFVQSYHGFIACAQSRSSPSFNAIDRAAQNHDPIPNRLKESRSRSVRPDRPRGSILRHPPVRPATTWAKTATNSVAPCAYMRTPPLPHREFDPTDPHLAQPLTLGARSAGRGSTFDRLDRRTAHDPTADVESSDFPA